MSLEGEIRALRGQDVKWSRSQNRKRMIEKMGREDETSEDKKMIIPPIGKGFQSPVDYVELQVDDQQLALRKALPNHAATSVVERCDSNVSLVFLSR